MLDKIDNVVEMIFRAKGDKKTLVLAVSGLIAFGVSVGAVAVYEKILHELELDNTNKRPYRPSYLETDEEDDYEY